MWFFEIGVTYKTDVELILPKHDILSPFIGTVQESRIKRAKLITPPPSLASFLLPSHSHQSPSAIVDLHICTSLITKIKAIWVFQRMWWRQLVKLATTRSLGAIVSTTRISQPLTLTQNKIIV